MGQTRFSSRFILLPSFVSLACFACASVPGVQTGFAEASMEASTLEVSNRQQTPNNKESEALALAKATQTTAVDSQAAEISTAAYREGINLASSAYNLSQFAVSPDDWSLIAARWQRAAEQLKKVSTEDKNYTTAQQKIPEYVRNAEQATAQLQALEQSVNTPLPVRSLAAAPANKPIQKPAPKIATANTSPSSSITGSATRRTQLPASVQLPAAAPSAQVNPTRGSRTRQSTAAPTSSNSPDASGNVQIPIVRRLHGTPVVRVMFNGERSYEMILDTGASRTLITRPMADELGIVATDRMIAATASANDVTFELGQMKSISMGAVTLHNAQVSIGETVNIGLLGNDFLRGYDVTIRERAVELVAASPQ